MIDTPGRGITQEQKQYLVKIMETSKSYLQNLLKVYPIQNRNMFSKYWGTQCIEIDVPQNDLKLGVADSDLHIYVIYENSPNESYIANAGFCSIHEQQFRPNYGRVNFNIAKMGPFSNDSEQFGKNLETTIHEIIHVLGFSGDSIRYWIDPETNRPYGNNVSKITKQSALRGKKTTLLFSKNVLETTRKYYNCKTAEGMQLENEVTKFQTKKAFFIYLQIKKGGGGSLGSHWEKSIINNELMSPSASLVDAQLSVFTIALLKDTGFYAEVNENMADNIYWGYQKGCEFLNNVCYSKTSFPEFPQNSQTIQCSYQNEGYGLGYKELFSDNCYTIIPYSNRLCIDPKNNSEQGNDERLESYGHDSKCFQSTANKSNWKFDSQNRCHKFKCSADKQQITIYFPQLKNDITCSISQQGQAIQIDKNNRNLGEIICPSNFETFCTYTPVCPNHCSENGICVKGYCQCNPGYGNADCSLKCEKGQFVENNSCVSQCSDGYFLNPDSTCKATCPQTFYKKNGKCLACHASCSSCTDESPKSCQSCQFLTFFQEGSCVSKCSSGYVLNDKQQCINSSNTNDCQVNNCSQCDPQNNQRCLQCKPDYFLDQTFICVQQCPQGQFANLQSQKCENCISFLNDCAECSNSTTCTLCNSLDKTLQNGKCENNEVQCPINCGKCENSSKCIKCLDGYFLDYTYSCVKQCYQGQYPDVDFQMCMNCNVTLGGCKECTSKDVCIQCEKGKILSNKKCIDQTQQCPQNCQQCENSNKCLQCNQDFFLDYRYSCVSKCYFGQFGNTQSGMCENCNTYMAGCITCSDQNTCLSCSKGLTLYQGKCYFQCPSNCQTCESSTKCKKCQQGYFLDYKLKCVKQCYQGQFANPISQWCENCNQYIPGCLECNNTQQCLICDNNNGYYLSGNVCIKKRSLQRQLCQKEEFYYEQNCYVNCPQNTKPFGKICIKK